MDPTQRWTSTGRAAWTEHDGPGLTPRAVPGWYSSLVASALAAGFAVVIVGEALCPEHRVWARALGVVGVALGLGAVASTLRGSAASPGLTVGASIAGIAIGAIDAAHAPLRGVMVTAAFGAALMLAGFPLATLLQATRWAHRTAADMEPLTCVPRQLTPTIGRSEQGVLVGGHH